MMILLGGRFIALHASVQSQELPKIKIKILKVNLVNTIKL